MSWLSSFNKRIKLTVDNTNVDGTLSNFPVLVKLSDSSGISSTNVTDVFTELGSDANRKKIAVTTSDEVTQCYVEIERFDYSNSVAELWVKVPTVVSGTTTDLYLYYDSDQDDNTVYIGNTGDTPAQSVWDSNFKLVMHMAQDPNGDVADAIKDSTSNTNHGTPAGSMATDDLVDGKVGKGINFDGNDYIDLLNQMQLVPDNADFTLESTALLLTGSTFFGGGGNTGDNWSISLRRNMYYYIVSGSLVSVDIDNVDSVWAYFTTLRTGNDFEGYVDGIYDTKSTQAGVLRGGTNNFVDRMLIGARWTNGVADHFVTGTIDEVRISNIARSADWIKATYYSNWDELISFGSEETVSTDYISGYVKEGTIPVNRQIYLHNRTTGELVGSTTSSGMGGYFYCETTYSGAHYVVCLDDMVGVDYNDLIYGNIYPATTSG